MSQRLRERFGDVMTTEEEVREHLGHPSHRVTGNVVSEFDDICQRWISSSTYMVMATASAAGELNVTPKGDPAGSWKVLDAKTLAIGDRPGNRRGKTLLHIIENPNVAMIFLVPGRGETLRIQGQAVVTRNEALRKTLEVNNHVPEFAIAFELESGFFHCMKSGVRGNLWKPENWPDLDKVPTMAESLIAHASLQFPDTLEKMQRALARDAVRRLYEDKPSDPMPAKVAATPGVPKNLPTPGGIVVFDNETGTAIREGTEEELRRSREAALRDGGIGLITDADGRLIYVVQ